VKIPALIKRGKAGILATAIGAALAFTPFSAFALALGKIKVKSALNEPLNAEIEFASVTDKELKGFNAALAPRAEFDTAGVERLPFLSQIKFTVSKKLDGRYYLQLSTDQQIEEPFLHFLLQIDWQGGRLVREYSALIDPPTQFAAKPAAVEVPATLAAPLANAAEAEPLPVTVPAAPKPAEAVAQVEEIKPPQPEPAKVAKAEPEPVKPVEAAKPVPQPLAEPEPLFGPGPIQPEPVQITPGSFPQETPSAQVESLPPMEPSAAVEPLREPSDPVLARTAPNWSNVSQIKVNPGDNLWGIAEKVRADKQLGMEQVAMALYRSNKDAFFGNNVNNLKAGKILTIPEREEVDSVPQPSAIKEFRAQYDVWQEYKIKLAGTAATVKVAEAPAEKPAPAPKAPAATKPEAKPETKPAIKPEEKPAAAPKKGAPDDLLKIVRGDTDKQKTTTDKNIAETESTKEPGKQERQALAERVTTLEESLISKQQEQKELSDKIGQVRNILKKETKLLEIESKPLAEATSKPQPPKEPQIAAAPAPQIKAEPLPPKAPEAPKPEAKPEVKAEAPKAEAAPSAKIEKEVPKKRVTPPPAPVPEEKGFLASLMDDVGNVWLPVVMGLIVIAAGAIGIVYMRRRKKSIAEFEESILSSEAMVASEPALASDTTSGQAAGSGDTSFLSDFSQGGMGTMHTDEVDPIAEAEVYLAYGRDETAEEILKDAIVKNPQREEIKVKLLEIYHQRNDVGAFETLAEEYYAQLGGRASKLWEKVEEMGRKLNPENPMFRGGGAKPEASPAAAFAKTLTTSQANLKAPSSTEVMAATAAESGSIDFDGAAPAAASDSALDLDFDEGAAQTQTPTGIDFDLGEARSPKADTGLNMDFGQPAGGIDFDSPKLSVDDEATHVPELDNNTTAQWDLAAPPAAHAAAGEAGGQWDETATKLDLAKAYIDMGDAEGAKSILNEVLAEGSDDQKKQARDLVSQIG
jgi:pilus assembly protein FimV